MYKILIVTALSGELKAIKSKLKTLNILNVKLDFFTTWMWNYNTILHLTAFLSQNKYDFVLNIGSAGFLKLQDKTTNFLQIWQILNLANQKEKIPPISCEFANLANIFCSEIPVSKAQKLPKSFADNILVDMESYGFESTCDFFKIPRAILKIPVDEIWEKFQAEIFIKKAENIDYKIILEKIVNFLKNIPPNIDLSKYVDFFRFSSSQQRIFTQLYNRFQALNNKKFEKFFQENKNLNRKQFLAKLSQTPPCNDYS